MSNRQDAVAKFVNKWGNGITDVHQSSRTTVTQDGSQAGTGSTSVSSPTVAGVAATGTPATGSAATGSAATGTAATGTVATGIAATSAVGSRTVATGGPAGSCSAGPSATRKILDQFPSSFNDEELRPQEVRQWFVVTRGKHIGYYSDL